ncbi:MAG: thiamine phosphate synthase [Proteobacteria bacterium]|nr:thiamine phosphate synthase [Pseudomonadota bacterium]
MTTLPRLYPIVETAAWVERIAGAGATLIQLRNKTLQNEDLRGEVRAALAAAKKYGCALVLNDYWQLAIEEGAPWVHLGQEDLDTADLSAIRKAGIKLGLSTHDEPELERALACAPDYVALGPVYPTTLKAMRFAPQGLERIGEWKTRVGNLPLVAIGGITLERAPLCLAAGADSVSMVSEITANPDPEGRTKALISTLR